MYKSCSEIWDVYRYQPTKYTAWKAANKHATGSVELVNFISLPADGNIGCQHTLTSLSRASAFSLRVWIHYIRVPSYLHLHPATAIRSHVSSPRSTILWKEKTQQQGYPQNIRARQRTSARKFSMPSMNTSWGIKDSKRQMWLAESCRSITTCLHQNPGWMIHHEQHVQIWKFWSQQHHHRVWKTERKWNTIGWSVIDDVITQDVSDAEKKLTRRNDQEDKNRICGDC